MKAKLEKGEKYWGSVRLSFVESVASNDRVAQEFRDLGFTDVQVQGSGQVRTATGVWNGGNQEFELPQRVISFSKAVKSLV